MHLLQIFKSKSRIIVQNIRPIYSNTKKYTVKKSSKKTQGGKTLEEVIRRRVFLFSRHSQQLYRHGPQCGHKNWTGSLIEGFYLYSQKKPLYDGEGGRLEVMGKGDGWRVASFEVYLISSFTEYQHVSKKNKMVHSAQNAHLNPISIFMFCSHLRSAISR